MRWITCAQQNRRPRSTVTERLAHVAGSRVDVWRTQLDVEPKRLESLARVLSADELARASRFHRVRDRSRFVAAHAALRSLLSRHTGIEPSAIRFEYSERGKPRLGNDPRGRASEIEFNLSHSSDLCLIAVARGASVGVDVEKVRNLHNLDGLAATVLSARELGALNEVSPHRRVSTFFDLWVRKEAVLKATGEGLSKDLGAIDLHPALDSSAGQGWSLVRAGDGTECLLRSLRPAAGFRGAVAVARGRDGGASRIVLRSWTP